MTYDASGKSFDMLQKPIAASTKVRFFPGLLQMPHYRQYEAIPELACPERFPGCFRLFADV
jgi:hypothetical protein